MGVLIVLAAALALAAPPAPALNRGNAAVAGAPGLLLSAGAQGQTDSCIGIQSAAYGSPVLGVTFDIAHTDRNCARIRQARILQQLGYDKAAVQVMCEDREVRDAMERAGTACALQRVDP